MSETARYATTSPFDLAEGWALERLTQPSRLFGANGIRTGPDGRIYVAQVAGSQISAIDLSTGDVETISAKGSDIVAPDDVAFDSTGDMYVTEYYDGRVSVQSPDGRSRLLRDDLPGANGITIHQDRLFVNECRIGGRLMEIDRAGGAPRILAENLPMPNGMEVGPDGMLYYPMLGTNEIWRIDPNGGEPELVAGDLGVPDAVKFDSEGFIVSTQVASGQVLRIDPRNGDRTVLAQLSPGLDNLTFVGERLFVSSFTGLITEIGKNGETSTALPDGLTWPLDLAVDHNGALCIADGSFLLARNPDGEIHTLGMLFTPGFPGYTRGIAAAGNGEFIVAGYGAAGQGAVSRYVPSSNESELLAAGLEEPYGVAIGPSGIIAVADRSTGSVLSVQSGATAVMATGLDRPMGVAFSADGTCLVSESGAGRIAHITASGSETILDGLGTPQGIAVHGGSLFIVDVGSKSLIELDLTTKAHKTIASNLPVGAPEGITPKTLKGLPPLAGPQGPFAGIAIGADGTIYVSGDADGSLIALKKEH